MATSIIGLASLERKLRRLPKIMTDEVRLAMEGQANEIVRMMKSLVAFDDGDLQISIGWTWGTAPKGSLTIAKIARKNLGAGMTLTIYAGNSEAFYARWIEFGTAPHTNGGLFAGSANPGTSAQPFFFVSFRANKRSAKAAIRKAIRSSAKKVAAK